MKTRFVYGFLLGAAVGGVVGLLVAPVRGAAARTRIAEAADPAFVKLSGLKVNFKAWVDSASESIRQSI
jgi:gas vesicle protein